MLRPGGMLVLAVPTRARSPGARSSSAGERLRWGAPRAGARVPRERGRAVEAETREHAVPARVPDSLAAAWEAYAGPFGLPAGRAPAFEATVAERSPGPGAVGMRDHWLLVMARRGG